VRSARTRDRRTNDDDRGREPTRPTDKELAPRTAERSRRTRDRNDERETAERDSVEHRTSERPALSTGSGRAPERVERPRSGRGRSRSERYADERDFSPRGDTDRLDEVAGRRKQRDAVRNARRAGATDDDVEPWTPTARLREAASVHVLRSSRCDERGALVVDVRLPRREHLDPNALRVVSRLVRSGFEAYLVGGCVRDLLIGRRPKDFDVATEAHPREVKRLFRNGRIIGRRFKLVHVVYGGDVVETATFRAAPKSLRDGGGDDDDDDDPTVDDLMIVDDNEFGTAAEDALRRDFTINGLFLDPLEGEIIDYVDGLEDVESRLIRTIGDPRVRIAEDPVRIMRAIKFASRLDFTIHKDTWDAMVEHAGGLAQAAAPRVVEEILRLLQSGHSRVAFSLLDKVGALPILLPALVRWRSDTAGIETDAADGDDGDLPPLDRSDGWAVLAALDERIRRGEAPTTSFCLAALFAPAFLEAWEEIRDEEHHSDIDAVRLAARLLTPLSAVARLSRRDVAQAKRLLANQPRFTQSASKRFKPLMFVHTSEFDESLDLLALRIRAGCEERAVLDRWLERREEARDMPHEAVERQKPKRRPRRRRRRS
jgi:poly(A) polymerase